MAKAAAKVAKRAGAKAASKPAAKVVRPSARPARPVGLVAAKAPGPAPARAAARPTGGASRTASIAEVGQLIFRRPAPEPAAPPADAKPGAKAGAPPGAHPATADRTDRRTRRDVFDLDPRRVVERGPYIREWDESGEAFERLAAAVAARGEIDTPLWVRSSGPAGQRTFVLVAGKGRLRAALRAALATVPVRDLGELSDQEAVARQLEENLNRQDMTPAQTAHALWVTHGFGESVSSIGRRLHRDKGYVSYMVRVGEALDALAPAERAGLARRGALQVRQCQTVGALPDVAARAAALRRLLAAAEAREAPAARDTPDAGRDATRGRVDEQTPFYGRPIRGGRTFRLRWVEQDLRADPVGLAEGFVAAVQAEGAELAEALRRLEGEAGEGKAEVARARRALERAMRR